MNIGQLTFWQFGMFQSDYTVSSTGMVIVWFSSAVEVEIFVPGISEVFIETEKFAYLFDADKKVEVLYIPEDKYSYIINSSDKVEFTYKTDKVIDQLFILPTKATFDYTGETTDLSFLNETGLLFNSTSSEDTWILVNKGFSFSDTKDTEFENENSDFEFVGEK